MAFVTCDDTVGTGVESLDREHRQLAALINAIHAGLFTDASDERLEQAFVVLADFASLHFRHEEELFRQTRYPAAADHMRHHAELKAQLSILEAALLDRKGPLIELAEKLGFLSEWLMEHVEKDDKAFGDYAKQAGIR